MELPEANPHKGSRRGAGAVPGAIIGFLFGSILFAFTGNSVWMGIAPLIGIILGAAVTYSLHFVGT